MVDGVLQQRDSKPSKKTVYVWPALLNIMRADPVESGAHTRRSSGYRSDIHGATDMRAVHLDWISYKRIAN